jgi:type I restriction enzyme S subunit
MVESALDLTPDQWRIVHDILQRSVPEYEVWAFGSRARGEAKRYSDLDLAIITTQPMSLSRSAALAEEFAESELPFKVDIVDWAVASDTFRQIIERQRVVVQKGNARQPQMP